MSELLAWFIGKSDRRAYVRKKASYPAAWVDPASKVRQAAIGMDISGSGLRILSQGRIQPKQIEVHAQINSRMLRVRCEIVWEHVGTHRGKEAWMYGMRFVGISADDWDAIIRFANGLSADEPTNKALEEIKMAQMSPDDVSRLFPQRLQNKLLALLVQRRRLAPIDPKVYPLVKYHYGGIVSHQGQNLHRLKIYSRIADSDGEQREFNTVFLFDDAGSKIVVSD